IAYEEDLHYIGTPAAKNGGWEPLDQASVSLIARARILLVNLEKQSEGGVKQSDLENLISSAINYTPDSGSGFLPMLSETRMFSLRRSLEMVKEGRWAEKLTAEISRAEDLLFAEELAAAVVDRFPASGSFRPLSEDDVRSLVLSLRRMLEIAEESELTEKLKFDISKTKELLSTTELADTVRDSSPGGTLFDSWPENTVRRLELPEEVFGIYHKSDGRIYLLLQTANEVQSGFDIYANDLRDLDISYRIVDGSERYVCGVKAGKEQPFLKAPAGKLFPGWRIELYFTDADVLKRAASRQVAVYTWTGALVIVLILVAGGFAGQVVGRQIKLNRLKNDFIATVSHELKTPLASMRVLVDTLLEGNYRDQKQAVEYLQLVSNENERLSRLIDNFLTFSRMERNKQAFDMLEVSPAAIARGAAEVVKTKFEQGRSKFDMNIDENLPDVLADHGAMVTALVNLLDNAYKYSYDDKRIELRVFAEDGSVCFRVVDNGVGLSRRAARKIFSRFYQVDRSLTRGTEGCGLGLSIVKFIVDAHKGSISVDSKPGKGSTFTVKLPVVG
ncbi:MAG: sensor histidine kinase, partial [Planctomycetota bacterium]